MCETIDKILEGLNAHFDKRYFNSGYDDEGNLYFRCNGTELFFNKKGAIIKANSQPITTPYQSNEITD